MAEDLIEEWKAAPAAPAPAVAGPAPAIADDLIDEWRRTLPAATRENTAAGKGKGVPRKPADDWINELVRQAHGHGDEGGESWGDVGTRAAAGAGAGVRDVAATIARGIAALGDAGAGALARGGVISPETARDVADWRAAVNARVGDVQRGFEEAGPGAAGELGRIGGQVLGSGPFLSAGGAALGALPGAATAAQLAGKVPGLPLVAGGAATGAGINALTSSASDEPGWKQALYGAGGGAVLGPFGHFIGHLTAGAVDRETAALAQLARDKYGIPIRIDQISANPMVRFGGSVAQRTPGTGLAGSVAEQQGAFNRAVANTFGENADKITPDVMAAAKSRMANVFETTLPKLEAHLNPNVSARLTNIQAALPYLPAEDARIIQRLTDDIIGQFGLAAVGKAAKAATREGAGTSRVARFAQNMTESDLAQSEAISRALGGAGTGARAPMSGRQVQALIASGSPLDRAINAGSANVRYYASQLKDVLLDAVGQTPTGRAKTAAAYVRNLQDFQRARFQYKNMKTIEDLVEKSATGDISPALLMGQVRQSFGNMAYGGGGDLAELARIGQRFLKEPPSSGTAERLAMMKLGAGAAAGLGGIAAFDPEHFQRDAALLAGALAAARTGGTILKSGPLARAAIRSGLRTAPPQLGAALTAGLPALAPRSNPLMLPAPQQQQ